MIDETIEEIQEMRTHSSSVVAVKATRALGALTDREFATTEEYLRSLERNSKALRRANRSHASLQNAQREVIERVENGDPERIAEAKELTDEAIAAVTERITTAKRRAARNGAAMLEDGTTILTHDYSSTVLGAIEHATGGGTTIEVYVTEARPRYLGRKTARTLSAVGGVDVTMLTDSACGHYLPDCDRVLVGMDCIVDDTLYNRIGTYPTVATAADLGVPVSVIGAGTKIIEEGFVFENEFRSPSEVMREPAEGFAIENPAYDATPTRLLDSVVTDEETIRY
jgi:translation initiation factor eIF-2B subunit delta